MPELDYSRFVRVLTRCREVAAEPDLPAVVLQVYAVTAEQPMTSFLDAAALVADAESDFARENQEAGASLDAVDRPYRVARSATAAVLKTVKLPETLKALKTDTDKLNAIERLLDILDDHVGQPWADTLLSGEFGQRGAAALKEVREAIAASKVLQKARGERAQAYGPAYEAWLGWKRVVRDALGSTSPQYRRIHVRSSGAADDVAEPAPEPAPAPPPVGGA